MTACPNLDACQHTVQLMSSRTYLIYMTRMSNEDSLVRSVSRGLGRVVFQSNPALAMIAERILSAGVEMGTRSRAKIFGGYNIVNS